MTQLALEQALPHVKGSATSKAAAESMRTRAGSLKAQMIQMFMVDRYRREFPGLTDEEGCLALAMNPSTYRPRRIELVRAGFLEDSGERRKTLSGHEAVVYRLKEQS